MKIYLFFISLMVLLTGLTTSSTGCTKKDEHAVPCTDNESSSSGWEIGQNLLYSQQCMQGDLLVVGEYNFGNRLEAQYITIFNLVTGEKERIQEILPGHRFGEPVIRGNTVVWPECILPPNYFESSSRDFNALDWNIFLLNLETREVKQITTNESVQRSPRISDDYVLWLDGRHIEDKEYPYYYDIYAYNLHTGEETRITENTTAVYSNLSISGNMVVWEDIRNDNPEIRIQEKPPIFNNDIYCYDLSTKKEIQITNNPASDSDAFIDDGRIVWSRQFGTINTEVYLYDIKTGREEQISKSGYAARQFSPVVYKDYIVWEDSRLTEGQSSGDCFTVDMESGTSESGSSEIYLYNLKTGEETRLVASKGIEFPEAIPHLEKELTTTAWQVLINPVIHNCYVVYTEARMTGSIVHVIKLEQ